MCVSLHVRVCCCISNYEILASRNACVTVVMHETMCYTGSVCMCVCVMRSKLKGFSHTAALRRCGSIILGFLSVRSRLKFSDKVCGWGSAYVG